MEIVLNLHYDYLVRMRLCSKQLNSCCLEPRVNQMILGRRRKVIELKPRKCFQAFERDDLKVGAIIHRVMLFEFTQYYPHLLTKPIKIVTPCECGEKRCTRHSDVEIVGRQDCTDLESYEKFNFIRANKYDGIRFVPYVITMVSSDVLFVRKVEKVGTRYQYVSLNDVDEILRPYNLNQSRVFSNRGDRVGYVFGNQDIAIVPNSFKRK